jgi:hypothetical protein
MRVSIEKNAFFLDSVSSNVKNYVVCDEQKLQEIEVTLAKHEPCLIEVEIEHAVAEFNLQHLHR